MTTRDFLLEIGCEELPAKGLLPFVEKIAAELTGALKTAQLKFENYEVFATPRRLAVLVKQLSTTQPDRQLEKRGPALSAPEKAITGFIKSLNVTAEDLLQENGYWMYRTMEIGQSTNNLLAPLVQETINKLGGTKWKRWGNHKTPFLRPIRWIVMLFGDELINTELFGIKASHDTYGHHFHHPAKIHLSNAGDYEDVLIEEGCVHPSFEKRRVLIKSQVEKLAVEHHGKAFIDEDLLDEVTGLVEWPVALWCQFPEAFLKVPKEALISSMQHHQKCFPVQNEDNSLNHFFITVSNIKSHDPKKVVQGNERVMRARLSDAAFFYTQDLKEKLSDRGEMLEKITFQQKLGSVADKVRRIQVLAEIIATLINADQKKVARAATLSKCDLTTGMVGEFPELQGIMGYYYAKAQHEDEEVALAIREHYLPRFAGDVLPKQSVGCAIALADRIDTLMSIFKINQAPTGDKDPFGLRRSANGVIRIIIEKQLANINLSEILASDVKNFILERLPAYYQDQNISSDTIQSVIEVQQDNLFDAHKRILAVEAFRQLPEAQALSEANKRVKNILRKNNQLDEKLKQIDQSLFEHDAERNLYQHLNKAMSNSNGDYQVLLKDLALLKEPIDGFFDKVMVEVENEKIKNNRIELLKNLRNLFLQIADISLLGIPANEHSDAKIGLKEIAAKVSRPHNDSASV